MLFDNEKQRYDAFHLNEDGFIYNGSPYRLDEISHLFFCWVRTTQRLNFVKVGEPERADLRLILSSGIQIKLSFDEAGGGIFGRTFRPYGWNKNKKGDIHSVVELFGELSKRTFTSRLNYYLRQLRDIGYFIYDECYFYPGNKIVFRNKEFFIKNSSFLKGSGYIEMRPKEVGIVGNIVRELTVTKLPQFNTRIDSDVIFFILDKYFSLKWN